MRYTVTVTFEVDTTSEGAVHSLVHDLMSSRLDEYQVAARLSESFADKARATWQAVLDGRLQNGRTRLWSTSQQRWVEPGGRGIPQWQYGERHHLASATVTLLRRLGFFLIEVKDASEHGVLWEYLAGEGSANDREVARVMERPNVTVEDIAMAVDSIRGRVTVYGKKRSVER